MDPAILQQRECQGLGLGMEISGPTQTGRTTTVAPAPSRRSTCQPGTPGTSHQWRHRATATPATRENSIATKETPWGRGLQRQSPRLQTKNHRSSAHRPSCNQKGVPLKTVRSQLQRGQKNPATKMSEQRGDRRQRHRPLVTRQWKTHKLPIRKTTQQTGILHSETPPQPTAKKRTCKADFTVFRQAVVGPRSG